VSLALSFFLWLAISGQDMSMVEITAPMELKNLPPDLALRTEVPSSVMLQVLANAAQVRFLSDRKPQVWVDVSAAQEGRNAFPVLTDDLDLPRGVQIRRTQPAVIEFEADLLTSKVLPVKPILTGTPAAGFLVKSVAAEPDKITVRGVAGRIAELKEVPTNALDISNRTSGLNAVATPALNSLGPGLTFTPREIRVVVGIEERMLERTFDKLPLSVHKTDDGLLTPVVKVSPKTVRVVVRWPASSTNSPTSGDISARVEVDMKQLEVNGDAKLELPVIVAPPPGVAVVSIEPVMDAVTVSPPPPAPY
jgi:hypothetical protein